MSYSLLLMVMSPGLDEQLAILPPIPVPVATSSQDTGEGLV